MLSLSINHHGPLQTQTIYVKINFVSLKLQPRAVPDQDNPYKELFSPSWFIVIGHPRLTHFKQRIIFSFSIHYHGPFKTKTIQTRNYFLLLNSLSWAMHDKDDSNKDLFSPSQLIIIGHSRQRRLQQRIISPSQLIFIGHHRPRRFKQRIVFSLSTHYHRP